MYDLRAIQKFMVKCDKKLVSFRSINFASQLIEMSQELIYTPANPQTV